MKGAKTIIILLVLVILVLSVLIACSHFTRVKPEQTDPSTAGTTETQFQTAPETTRPETQPPETTVETTPETTDETVVQTTGATTVPEVTVEPDYSIGSQAAALAVELLGKPYKYGAAGPEEFDASGLLQYIYAQFDISAPRSVKEQAQFGAPVAKEDIQPGDAVFFCNETPGLAQFVGIYVGDGKFIGAFNSSKPVCEQKFNGDYFTQRYVCARRFYDPWPEGCAPDNTLVVYQDLLSVEKVNNMYNRALSCVFSTPEELPLDIFLYPGIRGAGDWADLDQEVAQYLANNGLHRELDLQVIPVDTLELILGAHFDIAISDLALDIPESWVYCEASNSYYTNHNDALTVHDFTVTQVLEEDGLLRIFYTVNQEDYLDSRTGQVLAQPDMVLTLKVMKDGSYRIQSNIPAAELTDND